MKTLRIDILRNAYNEHSKVEKSVLIEIDNIDIEMQLDESIISPAMYVGSGDNDTEIQIRVTRVL